MIQRVKSLPGKSFFAEYEVCCRESDGRGATQIAIVDFGSVSKVVRSGGGLASGSAGIRLPFLCAHDSEG